VKENIAEYLAVIIRNCTGFNLIVADFGEIPRIGDIMLVLGYCEGTTNESYSLKIEQTFITITANEPDGLFRGIQTLRQLFGADIERKIPVYGKKWKIACAEITDSPLINIVDDDRCRSSFFPKRSNHAPN
jgi:hexosaminidase